MALLTFHGATRQVTGSCYLIEANGEKVLLECGMTQGFRRDEEQNRSRFPFDPKTLSAVVISHAHLDHSGLLPKLVAEGFSGSIYLTPDTADLLALTISGAASAISSSRVSRPRERSEDAWSMAPATCG